MKNVNNNKYLLFSFIRKHLNPITVNLSRVRKKILRLLKN